MAGNWTERETSALIGVYLQMLELQTAGKLGPGKSKTSKAVLVRKFIADFAPDRSKGSVEMKLMNISFARKRAGLAIVDGYKPLSNCSVDLLALYPVENDA